MVLLLTRIIFSDKKFHTIPFRFNTISHTVNIKGNLIDLDALFISFIKYLSPWILLVLRSQKKIGKDIRKSPHRKIRVSRMNSSLYLSIGYSLVIIYQIYCTFLFMLQMLVAIGGYLITDS